MKTIGYSSSIISDAVRAHLQKLNRQKSGAKKGADREYIHQMRITARRLRTGLRVFKGQFPEKKRKVWAKYLRQATRCLGQARDLDIHIALLMKFRRAPKHAAYARRIGMLIALLRQQRRELQTAVIAAIVRLEESGVLSDMEQALKTLREKSRFLSRKKLHKDAVKIINKKINTLMAYESCALNPDAVRRLHAMRIAAKELRYTLEYFCFFYGKRLKPYIDTAHRIQDILGAVHDFDVWIIEILPALDVPRDRDKHYIGDQL